MAVAAGPIQDLRAQLEEAVSQPGLAPAERIAKLRSIHERLAELAGVAQTYIGDVELLREAEYLAVAESILLVRQNATLRRQLVQRGVATEAELDEAGYLSHEELDRLSEEGRLIESVEGIVRHLDSFPLSEAFGSPVRFDPHLHPRDRTGKFRNILGKLSHGQEAHVRGSGVKVRKVGDGYEVHSRTGTVEKAGTDHEAASKAIGFHDAHAPAPSGTVHLPPKGRHGGNTPTVLHTHPPDSHRVVPKPDVEADVAGVETVTDLKAALAELTADHGDIGMLGEDDPLGEMRDALSHSTAHDEVRVVRSGGKIVGAISWRHSSPYDDGQTKISNVGALEKGRGAELVNEAVKAAAAKNEGVTAESVPSAAGFYEALGFTQTGKSSLGYPEFSLSAEEVKQRADPTAPKGALGRTAAKVKGGGTVATEEPLGVPGPDDAEKEKLAKESNKVSTSDVDEAVKALADGKHVELHQPDQVTTLLRKLHVIVQDMKDKGENAPNFDLCRVTVRGTNIFCVESKGIPRLQMPQLKGIAAEGTKAADLEPDKRGEVDLSQHFRDHLIAQGVKVEDTTVLASHIRASQRELNGAKVAGIYNYLDGGGTIEGPPIFVSNENYVVDGHHRWAAEIGRDFSDNVADLPMDVQRIDMPILDLLRAANDFAAEWGIPQAGFSAGFGTTDKKVAEAARRMWWKLALGMEFDASETALIEALLTDEGIEFDADTLREAVGVYVERLHPRDRLGKWMEKIAAFQAGRKERPVEDALREMFLPHELGLPDYVPQKHNEPDALYENARKRLPGFQRLLDFGEGVAQALQATAEHVVSKDEWERAKRDIVANPDRPYVVVADLKKREAATHKANGKYKGDWTHLTDIVRGTVLVPHPADVPHAMDAIRENAAKLGWRVSAIEGRMVKVAGHDSLPGPLPGGYRDLSLLVEAPDGFQAEIQVSVPDLWIAKEISGGHKLYEEARAIRNKAGAEDRDLTEEELVRVAQLVAEMHALYDPAWRRALKRPRGTLRVIS